MEPSLRPASTSRHKAEPMTGDPAAECGDDRVSSNAPNYGALLWGSDPSRSASLEYVRVHANRAVQRADSEDPRAHYSLHKRVQDVRVYRRVVSSSAVHSSAAPTLSPASSFASSRGSTRDRATSSTIPDDVSASGYEFPYEFRGVTRVPGNLDTIMAFLAPENARDAYWLAANTQKNLRFTAMQNPSRVEGASAAGFPRWSLQYLSTTFIKHSRLMECYVSEFAAMDAPRPRTSTNGSVSSGEGGSTVNGGNAPARFRRGFVYRRSVDERAMDDEELLAQVAASGSSAHAADRFFLHDWLLDVHETAETHVCKLVLTSRALFHGDPLSRRSLQLEFREFCTNMLISVRKLLAAHWAELLNDRAAAARLSTSTSSAVRASAGPLALAPSSAASRTCRVCSSAFSLLRKRHSCRSCGAGVCAKCCGSRSPPAGSVSNAGLLGNDVVGEAAPRSHRRQCVLCALFGSSPSGDSSSRAATLSRVTRSVRRAFNESMESEAALTNTRVSTQTPLSSTRRIPLSINDDDDNDDDNDDDIVAPDLDASFIGASSRGRSHVPMKTSDLDPDPEPSDNRLQKSPTPQQHHQQEQMGTPRRNKFRTDSNDSTASARSAPGIVLISDIDTLSLSGSFRRVPSGHAPNTTTAARNSVRFKRPDRAVSEDNVLAGAAAAFGPPGVVRSTTAELKPRTDVNATSSSVDSATTVSDGDEEDVKEYSDDDLANFTLHLA